MRKFYHLSTCSTCARIIKELGLTPAAFTMQDIKTEPISAAQLDEMKALAGSYEALFSRKALKFRSRGLHEKTLTEKEYRSLILEEYTFLKRPVLISGKQIFIGNAPKTVQSAKAIL